MFLFKILIQCLLLGATIAVVVPDIPTDNTIPLKQEHGILMDRNENMIPTAATTTIPLTKMSNSDDAPSPTQSGLISTCDAYYSVEKGDYCAGIVSKFGNFTLTQFYTWNPAVKSDCSQLLNGYYVCIGVAGTSTTSTNVPTTTNTPDPAPSPTQSGIANNCDDYYKVSNGDTCIGICDSNNITLADFHDWNPAISVSSGCQDLISGYYVCVGVGNQQKKRENAATITTTTATAAPSPIQSGIVSGCTKYYQAQDGDTCVTVVNGYYPGITVDQFESWNPAVGTNCNGLLPGYYFCVAA